MNEMPQLSDKIKSLNSAFTDIQDTIKDLRRTWIALAVKEHPDRRVLERESFNLLYTLNSDSVQINVIASGMQFTICQAPDNSKAKNILSSDSLCVYTTALDMPLASQDLRNDPLTLGHPVTSEWASWASVPLTVDNFNVGTICALERSKPRVWNLNDQSKMESAASAIAANMENWLNLES